MDGGDGHFVAKFRRKDGPSYHGGYFSVKQEKNNNELKQALELYQSLCNTKETPILFQAGNYVYYLPTEIPDFQGLHILRAGVQFGECKKNRMEPAHHFFMAAKPDTLRQLVSLETDDAAVLRYLKGEEIECDPALKGYAGVCVDGVMLGFGKWQETRSVPSTE